MITPTECVCVFNVFNDTGFKPSSLEIFMELFCKRSSMTATSFMSLSFVPPMTTTTRMYSRRRALSPSFSLSNA